MLRDPNILTDLVLLLSVLAGLGACLWGWKMKLDLERHRIDTDHHRRLEDLEKAIVNVGKQVEALKSGVSLNKLAGGGRR